MTPAPTARFDTDHLLAAWLIPGVAVLGAMAVGFTVVGGVLLAWEVVILGAYWSRLLALAVMYLFPHLLVGFWTGTRQGVALEPPIAAGFAPVVLLVVGLLLFGGPVSTPVRVPLVTLGAVSGWALTFAVGMVVGARVTPRGSAD